MKLRTLILHLESTRTRYHHHPSEIKAESESPLAASVDSSARTKIILQQGGIAASTATSWP